MTSQRARRALEWSCWSIGGCLLLFFIGAKIDSRIQRHAALEELGGAGADPHGLGGTGPVDTSLWSQGRIRAFERSLTVEAGAPLAVLRIPGTGLEVPVLEGTGELTLNRGIGRIPGTARPGQDGNLGLAGHRDGFFRGLEDVELGDELELELAGGLVDSYRVREILIVRPEDVYVLAPTPEPALTLVTCYPFYFVGKAPQRYIVRATRIVSVHPTR